MVAADLLCNSLLSWLENRKECAGKLLELAQELQKVHQDTNITQVVEAALALFATILTGLTGPLLVAAAAGPPVSITSTSVEAGMSRSTLNKANELIEEDDKVGMDIQKQLQDLKDGCGGTRLGAHADELECEVTTQLMWALARRNNTLLPLDFLRGFNRATFFRHLTPGGLAPAEASPFICRSLGLPSSPVIISSLKVSAKELIKNIGQIGIKAALKQGTRVPGAIGLGICLCELIVTSEKLVKGNRVMEASKFLQDSARAILEGQQTLKEQLDAMQEIIKKLFGIKNLMKELGEYSHCIDENGKKIIDYIMGTCRDNTVVSWLQGVKDSYLFLNLMRFCLEQFGPILEDCISLAKRPIDIVFVGHGNIVNEFIPAGSLVPTSTIRDTILYSPWNCGIDSKAAFAIAQGFIDVTNRKFLKINVDTAYCEPDPLPLYWNKMRNSAHDIPLIILTPMTPEQSAWSLFNQFWVNRSMEIEDRVVIPYVVPQHLVNALGAIPLCILIYVTSFILSCFNKTAIVHLVACLVRGESPLMPAEWRTQYAYTSDGIMMTVNMGNEDMNCRLFTALTSLFDR